VRGAARQVGQLKCVGIYRGLPELGESIQAADMIEVAMREDDRRRARPCAEARLGGAANPPRGTRQARINQGPAAIPTVWMTDEVEVDDRLRETDDVCRQPPHPARAMLRHSRPPFS